MVVKSEPARQRRGRGRNRYQPDSVNQDGKRDQPGTGGEILQHASTLRRNRGLSLRGVKLSAVLIWRKAPKESRP